MKKTIFDKYRDYVRGIYIDKFGAPGCEIEIGQDGRVYEHGAGGVSYINVAETLEIWAERLGLVIPGYNLTA